MRKDGHRTSTGSLSSAGRPRSRMGPRAGSSGSLYDDGEWARAAGWVGKQSGYVAGYIAGCIAGSQRGTERATVGLSLGPQLDSRRDDGR